MKVLLDTHLLLWIAGADPRLPQPTLDAVQDAEVACYFSVASIWEIVIKSGLGRPDFRVDARVLRRELIDAGYLELEISAAHVLGVAQLPAIHNDPFDRLLISQAQSEGLDLMTHDRAVSQYGAWITLV